MTTPAYIDNVQSFASNQILETLLSTIQPVGSIVLFAGTVSPTGWLLCNNSSVLRSAYPELFSVIGVIYGSLGPTTFTLPDLRSRVPIGVGAGVYKANGIAHSINGTLKTYTLGESLGAEYPSGVPCNTTVGPNTNNPGNTIMCNTVLNVSYVDNTEAPSGFMLGNTSIGNLPPFCALNYIIKF